MENIKKENWFEYSEGSGFKYITSGSKKQIKKGIFRFIKKNPTADITINTTDDRSYGLICLNLFDFKENVTQQIIYGEYDSDNTGCIDIKNNPENINLAIDRLLDIIESRNIRNVIMNE